MSREGRRPEKEVFGFSESFTAVQFSRKTNDPEDRQFGGQYLRNLGFPYSIALLSFVCSEESIRTALGPSF